MPTTQWVRANYVGRLKNHAIASTQAFRKDYGGVQLSDPTRCLLQAYRGHLSHTTEAIRQQSRNMDLRTIALGAQTCASKEAAPKLRQTPNRAAVFECPEGTLIDREYLTPITVFSSRRFVLQLSVVGIS